MGDTSDECGESLLMTKQGSRFQRKKKPVDKIVQTTVCQSFVNGLLCSTQENIFLARSWKLIKKVIS